MSGGVIKPDQWSQVQRTLGFLMITSAIAAVLAVGLLVVPWQLFWPLMFVTFIFAGGVYPAAQGIINTSLTADRVYEASVYQTQCNNVLFAMPLPFLIGHMMDTWGVRSCFHLVILIEVLAASSFATAFVCQTATRWRFLCFTIVALCASSFAIVIHLDGPYAFADVISSHIHHAKEVLDKRIHNSSTIQTLNETIRSAEAELSGRIHNSSSIIKSMNETLHTAEEDLETRLQNSSTIKVVNETLQTAEKELEVRMHRYFDSNHVEKEASASASVGMQDSDGIRTQDSDSVGHESVGEKQV